MAEDDLGPDFRLTSRVDAEGASLVLTTVPAPVADAAIACGGPVELNGTKTSDTNGGKRAAGPTPLPQKGDRGCEGCGRVCSGEALLSENFAATIGHGDDELGAAGFHCAE